VAVITDAWRVVNPHGRRWFLVRHICPVLAIANLHASRPNDQNLFDAGHPTIAPISSPIAIYERLEPEAW